MVALPVAPLAFADDSALVPYASAQAEYQSNIFNLHDKGQAEAENGDRTLDDTVTRWVAGVEGRLPVSLQTLHATVEGRHLAFSHFDRLDHDEYLVDAGLDWEVASALNGVLDYRQERRMASFEDRDTTALTIEHERTATGTANIDLDQDWRVETRVQSRQLDSPLPEAPQLRLEENLVQVGVKYPDEAALSYGAYAQYLDGRFAHVPGRGKFDQQTVAATLNYSTGDPAHISADDLYRIGAMLGYTQRQDQEGGGGKVSGITGAIDYHRQLTGKTSMDAELFRRVDSYVGSAGAQKETGGGIAFSWEATSLISLVGAYQRAQSAFQGSSGAGDMREVAALILKYQMLPWLGIRPYVGYQARDSNSALDSFHSEMMGLEVLARF
jgi:hypothetical protein